MYVVQGINVSMESAIKGVNIEENIRGYSVIADQKKFRSSKSKFLLSLYRIDTKTATAVD